MPSADFCAAVRAPCDSLSPFGTRRRPPQVSSIAFPAHLPDIQAWPLMDMDFAISPPARPTKPASYPVPVRQVAVLIHASFRHPLARVPLRFTNPSPPSGWIEDFHSQAIEHAGHTANRRSRPVPRQRSAPGARAGTGADPRRRTGAMAGDNRGADGCGAPHGSGQASALRSA